MRLKKSFLKVYPMRMFLIPVFTICFFMQTAQAEQERMLIPSGRTVGITMDTDGLLVLGTGSVNGGTKQDTAPCKGVLQAGDMILKANGKKSLSQGHQKGIWFRYARHLSSCQERYRKNHNR